jgi:ribosomal protein S18 acetylase RimI-like enzyme
MSFSTGISRFTDYYRRHGFVATIRRLAVIVRRSLFAGRSVLFYYDLTTQGAAKPSLPAFLSVERKGNMGELNPEDLSAMTSVWNPKLVLRTMEERFGLGALVWLIKSNGNLAGYGWTLKGRTVEPHYFPLGPNDIQFIDFHVFPKFRGRAIDWFLMTQILHQLAEEGPGRAFGESGEWNQASIASFQMARFRRLGMASKRTIFGRTIVSWSKIDTSVPSVGKKN